MIIAIDGPSASGKGTLAKKLAAHFDFDHLDTGNLYRAVGLKVLQMGNDPGDEKAAVKAARELDPDDLENPRLRREKTGHAASLVAAIPAVRRELLAFQRDFAENPPGGKGVVMDGRDIGTVVCPKADFKLFVIASPEERAKRRTREIEARGEPANYEKILEKIKERDVRDESRETSPLKRAEDAYLLDTTNLDIDGAFEKALSLLETKNPFRKT